MFTSYLTVSMKPMHAVHTDRFNAPFRKLASKFGLEAHGIKNTRKVERKMSSIIYFFEETV